MLHVDPAILERLDEIHSDLTGRRKHAQAEGWLGEVEGIDLTLRLRAEKRGEVQRVTRVPSTSLGMPPTRPATKSPPRHAWAGLAVSGDCRHGSGRPVGRQDCVKTVAAAAGGVHPDGMANSRPTMFGGRGSSLTVGSQVVLSRSRLTVRLRNEGEPPYLEVRSRLDPRQSCLVPLGHRPVLEGLSLLTRIGRVHALCWGLVVSGVSLSGVRGC